MNASPKILDLLVAEIAQLKKRVADLEKAAHNTQSEYVESWTGAARVLGISEKTCKRRSDFPVPCKVTTIEREDGKDHERPTWRRADLVAYAEGKRL